MGDAVTVRLGSGQLAYNDGGTVYRGDFECLGHGGDLTVRCALDAPSVPAPVRVVLSGPATVVFFDDGSKVVSKAAPGDAFDPVVGVALCVAKRTLAHIDPRHSPKGALRRLVRDAEFRWDRP